MNDTPLRPWLVFLPDGSISTAHCACMAGLGEVCSHAAAVAFAILFQNPELSEEELSCASLSCTDKLSKWTVPIKAKGPILPKRIKDINWGKKVTSYDGEKKLS